MELEKLTIRWFLDHLSLAQWAGLLTTALALVSFGAYLGDFTAIRKVFGRPPIDNDSAFLYEQAGIAALAEPFVIDLDHPYERGNVTHVDVHVTSLTGRAQLLAEAEILSVQFTQTSYLAPTPMDPTLISARPSQPLINPKSPTATIGLDFESGGVIPVSDLTVSARPGDRYPFGVLNVRLHFADRGQPRTIDTPIQMLFVR